MASKLEESTQTAKKIGIGCGIAIVVIVLIGMGSQLFKKEPEPYNPYPQYAQAQFGQLPSLEFESLKLSEESNPSFTIETTDSKLPNLPTIANAYKVKVPRQSLTAQDEATEIAKALDFRDDPLPISATELKWTSGTKTLLTDKLYKNVSLSTDYSRDVEATSSHDILPDTEPYIKSAQSVLKNAGLLPIEYETSNSTNVTFMKLNSSFQLEKAQSAQDANFVRVDFFKQVEAVGVTIPTGSSEKDVEYYESLRIFKDLLTDNPYAGLIYVILGGTGGRKDIYELQYINWELESKSTYELTPLDEVWKKLQSEKKYLRSLFEMNANPYQTYPPMSIQSFLLTNVDIAYYSPKDYSQYIQPIYKFTGIAMIDADKRADFTFYYPAVRTE